MHGGTEIKGKTVLNVELRNEDRLGERDETRRRGEGVAGKKRNVLVSDQVSVERRERSYSQGVMSSRLSRSGV